MSQVTNHDACEHTIQRSTTPDHVEVFECLRCHKKIEIGISTMLFATEETLEGILTMTFGRLPPGIAQQYRGGWTWKTGWEQ